MTNDTTGLLAMTTGILANYVSNNRVSPDELPGLITAIHGSLSGLGEPVVEEEPELQKPTAAQIRKSITPDYLISFEDGRQYKSMKRSLALKGLTPEQYREKWGLPKDYPMVAPSYTAARSALAKSMGLGAKGRQPKAAEAPAKPARKARAVKA